MHANAAIVASSSEHRRQLEHILEPIRHDSSIDDVERGRRISAILAVANARTRPLNPEHRYMLIAGEEARFHDLLRGSR